MEKTLSCHELWKSEDYVWGLEMDRTSLVPDLNSLNILHTSEQDKLNITFLWSNIRDLDLTLIYQLLKSSLTQIFSFFFDGIDVW